MKRSLHPEVNQEREEERGLYGVSNSSGDVSFNTPSHSAGSSGYSSAYSDDVVDDEEEEKESDTLHNRLSSPKRRRKVVTSMVKGDDHQQQLSTSHSQDSQIVYSGFLSPILEWMIDIFCIRTFKSPHMEKENPNHLAVGIFTCCDKNPTEQECWHFKVIDLIIDQSTNQIVYLSEELPTTHYPTIYMYAKNGTPTHESFFTHHFSDYRFYTLLMKSTTRMKQIVTLADVVMKIDETTLSYIEYRTKANSWGNLIELGLNDGDGTTIRVEADIDEYETTLNTLKENFKNLDLTSNSMSLLAPTSHYHHREERGGGPKNTQTRNPYPPNKVETARINLYSRDYMILDYLLYGYPIDPIKNKLLESGGGKGYWYTKAFEERNYQKLMNVQSPQSNTEKMFSPSPNRKEMFKNISEIMRCLLIPNYTTDFTRLFPEAAKGPNGLIRSPCGCGCSDIRNQKATTTTTNIKKYAIWFPKNHTKKNNQIPLSRICLFSTLYFESKDDNDLIQYCCGSGVAISYKETQVKPSWMKT